MPSEAQAASVEVRQTGRKYPLHVPDAEAMEALGAQVAGNDQSSGVIYLAGDLGAGKTTFVRGLVRALGWAGPVKSPTYTLLETYTWPDRRLYHFDLYRLADPEELELIGARELFGEAALVLIEWPERGAGHLPRPDLSLEIHHQSAGRRIAMCAHTPTGLRLMPRVLGV